MAEIKNRELSQFSSFLHIEDQTECIGITTTIDTPYIGIGTTNATSKLTVTGDILVSGILTASTLSATTVAIGTAIVASGSVTILSGGSLNYSGIGTINSLVSSSGIITNFSSGISTITNLVGTSATVTNLVGTAATITTLNGSTGTFTSSIQALSGIITSLSGTNLNYTGISTLTNTIVTNETVTNLVGTSGTFTNNLRSLSGIITSLSGTNLNYTGISTLTNIVGTSATITNLVGTSATITNIVGTSATVTNLVGTSATITNTIVTNETVTNLVGTSGTFTNNLRSLSGIITSLSGININYSGIATFSGVKISSGIVTSANSGLITYFGDGSKLSNVAANITVRQDGIALGTGLTTFDFTNVNGIVFSAGIATVNVATVASGTTGMVQFKSATGILTGTSNLSWDNTNNILTIAGTCSATNFNSTSDVNLKENVATVENALKIVTDLRGVKFNWKQNQAPSIGVIAQELEQVLPELVTQSDPKTVNYDGIIGVLIEAIKELKNEIDLLKQYK